MDKFSLAFSSLYKLAVDMFNADKFKIGAIL